MHHLLIVINEFCDVDYPTLFTDHPTPHVAGSQEDEIGTW